MAADNYIKGRCANQLQVIHGRPNVGSSLFAKIVLTKVQVLSFLREVTMRLSNFCFSALVASCAFSSLHAGTVGNHGQQKKLYLDEKAVRITKGAIVIESKNGPVTVKTLRANQHGIYVLKKDVTGAAKGRASKRVIKCRCGREFLGEGAYWRHIDSGECPYYPRRR